MRKYYTRPCNFYYGNYGRRLVSKKKAFILAGNPNIAFDKIEIFERKNKKNVKSNIFSIKSIENLPKKIKFTVKKDLKKITAKRKNFLVNLNFSESSIMGVLNLTPDSFSDGGKFNNRVKAFKHISHIDNI